jgi:NAD(P)-dependent dehydrogenase (short-subunit alcohol dehydrogenase family)
VFAGVRRRSSAPTVENLTEVMLDVSDAESVRSAFETVSGHLAGRGLDGLVNNAGIGMAVPMELIPPEQLRQIFAVNVFGLVAVTQAFLPLLHAAQGRIVNVSSIGGLITVPFGGALCATKRAVDAISEALRMELLPSGIHVSIVRPAAIHTPAADRLAATADEVVDAFPPEGRARYADELRRFLDEMERSEAEGSPPDVVAEVIGQALEAKVPHTVYLAGKNARLMELMGRWMPDEMRDTLLLKKLGLPHTFAAEVR